MALAITHYNKIKSRTPLFSGSLQAARISISSQQRNRKMSFFSKLFGREPKTMDWRQFIQHFAERIRRDCAADVQIEWGESLEDTVLQVGEGKLYLGNLSALRDWGYAKDYVECMWLMLQQPEADDFVIATGEMHTVREFCDLAFKEAGIELRWEGSGVEERGIDVATNRVLVEVDPKYFRPCEVEQLLGDPSKAKEKLGWNPTKTSFKELVRLMVKHDLEYVDKLHHKD